MTINIIKKRVTYLIYSSMLLNTPNINWNFVNGFVVNQFNGIQFNQIQYKGSWLKLPDSYCYSYIIDWNLLYLRTLTLHTIFWYSINIFPAFITTIYTMFIVLRWTYSLFRIPLILFAALLKVELILSILKLTIYIT